MFSAAEKSRYSSNQCCTGVNRHLMNTYPKCRSRTIIVHCHGNRLRSKSLGRTTIGSIPVQCIFISACFFSIFIHAAVSQYYFHPGGIPRIRGGPVISIPLKLSRTTTKPLQFELRIYGGLPYLSLKVQTDYSATDHSVTLELLT